MSHSQSLEDGSEASLTGESVEGSQTDFGVTHSQSGSLLDVINKTRIRHNDLGTDGKSLLCSESMPSSTPPSDESLKLSKHDTDTALLWKHDLQPHLPKSGLAHRTALGSLHSAELSGGKATPDHYSSFGGKHITDQNHNIQVGKGGDVRVEGRMNTDGFGRSAMTGSRTTSGDTLGWIGDVTAGQASRPHPPTGSVHSSSSSHDPPLMQPGSGGSGLFRPPAPTEPSQRLYGGQQYTPIYITTASGLSPYSPSVYGAPSSGQTPQLSSLTAYGAFYQHYAAAHGYSHALSGHFPHIESYSAVLANMGSHVQQHAQSQLPRSPYLPQYSALTPTNSPGPNVPRPMTPGQHTLPVHPVLDPHQREVKSPRMEAYRSGRLSSPSKDVRHSHGPFAGVQHSIPHRTGIPREPPKFDLGVRDMGSKGGSSGQGGRDPATKHRYIQRAAEGSTESSGYSEHRQSMSKSEDIPVKRHRGGSSPVASGQPHPTSSSAMQTSQTQAQAVLASSQPPNQPHYPPHFTKGSIIQLANGELKRVEDLRTDDFVQSADISSDLKIDSSTVVKVDESHDRGVAVLGFSVGEHRIQVTVEAMLEHPFFVFGQGWSSCSPERTMQRYGLSCQKLSVGDVCISLTHKDVSQQVAAPSGTQSQAAPSQSWPTSAPSTTSPDTSKVMRHTAQEPGASSGGGTVHRPPSAKIQEAQREDQPIPQQSIPSSSAQSTQVTRPGVIFPRKRRWSAPDHLRAEGPAVSDTSETTPSQGQGHD